MPRLSILTLIVIREHVHAVLEMWKPVLRCLDRGATYRTVLSRFTWSFFHDSVDVWYSFLINYGVRQLHAYINSDQSISKQQPS